MLNFKEFFNNTVGKHNDTASGAILGSDWTGSEMSSMMGMLGRPLHLPSMDFAFPNIMKQGIIKFMDEKKNPIMMHLSDGTRLHFSLDEFNRIKGRKPRVGRTVMVIFQRHPSDASEEPSQIQDVRCF